MRKKLFWIFAAIVGLLTAVYFIVLAPYLNKMSELKVYKLDDNLTIVMGGGANSGILTGDKSVLVIDTKMGEPSKNFYKMVKDLANGREIIVVNTHMHPDHISGNWFYQGSKKYAGGNYTPQLWAEQASKQSMPTDVIKDRMDIQVGNETVTLYNFSYPIHTQSDLVVYLHKRKLLFSGDLVLNNQVPALMKKNNASVENYLRALDELPKLFEIQTIVPGHGHTGGTDLIGMFKQYFLDMIEASRSKDAEKKMLEKYKDWNYIPFLMTNEKVIEYIRQSGEVPAKDKSF